MTATAAIADGGADAIRSLLITLVGGMERRGEERRGRVGGGVKNGVWLLSPQ